MDLRLSADEGVSASVVRGWLAGYLMLRSVNVAILNADVTGVVLAKRGLLIGSPPTTAAP